MKPDLRSLIGWCVSISSRFALGYLYDAAEARSDETESERDYLQTRLVAVES